MRYLVLAFLCAFTVIAYLQRLALSAPTQIIEGELGLGPAGMGTIMGVWYWTYALSQLPAGWITDRLGSKSALVLFAVAWSLVTAIAGFSTGFLGLFLLWGLMGCAQAGLFPCATKAIGATFPKNEQAFASGLLAASMGLGAAVAQWLTAQLLGPLAWQEILVLYAAPGLLWAAAFAYVVPRPEPAAKPKAADRVSEPHADRIRWLKLATDPQMQLLCAQQFLRASAIAFLYTWLPRFLTATRGITEQEAGELAFLPPLVGMCGGFLGGLGSEFILRQTGSSRLARQGMSVAAMLVSTSTALAAFFVADPDVAVILICTAAFCGMGAGVTGYALAISYGGKRVAIVFATMNMSGNVGAGLFPFVVGFLVKATGNWNHALLVFAGLFASSGLCCAFLNPKGTLFNDSLEPKEPTDDDAR